MAKKTTPTARQERKRRSQSIQGKTPREITTDRPDLLSVARDIFKVYSVNSKIISSKTKHLKRIER